MNCVSFYRLKIVLFFVISLAAFCRPQSDKNSGKWQPDGEKGECGRRTRISNIVGGKKTKLGDFPHMALLGYDVEVNGVRDGKIDGYRCGGSLINKWYVLTAAHCILGQLGEPAEIVLGEHNTRKDPDCETCPKKITRKAGKIIVHENYSNSDEVSAETYRNDIALIRLNESVPLFSEDANKSITGVVCLPWSEDDDARFIEDGDKTKATGWGKISNNQDSGNFVFSPILRQVQLPVANNLCTEYPFKIDSTQLCAGGKKGRDSCNADSGGPLVWRAFSDDPWYQVGIVSFGARCGEKDVAGVYTNVTAFIPWIQSKLED